MVEGGGGHHGNVFVIIRSINVDSSLRESQVVWDGNALWDSPFDAADLGDAT